MSIPIAHLLSNCSGVGPCGWTISMAACRIGRACLALMKPPPVSASWVELMTASMTLHGTWTGWLCIGGLCSGRMGRTGLSLKKWKPLAREHALGSDSIVEEVRNAGFEGVPLCG